MAHFLLYAIQRFEEEETKGLTFDNQSTVTGLELRTEPADDLVFVCIFPRAFVFRLSCFLGGWVFAALFFLVTGTIGFFSCHWFVWTIYSAIKVD